MNSIHRVGVMVASMVTVATIAGAFVVQGYVTAEQAAAAATTASRGPQIIYVAALPSAATAAPVQPQVIHVVVPGNGDDGGSD
jgi:uncharacterized protein (UPF0333 family)